MLSSSYSPASPPRSILLFDGVCNFCEGVVQFISQRDTERRFHFQALQTEKGHEILDYYHLPKDLSTVVLIEEETGTYYLKSTAILRVLYYLKYPYPMLYPFIYIPQFIRDYCYATFAQYRYKLFGKKDTDRCIVNNQLKTMFIDWKSPFIQEDDNATGPKDTTTSSNNDNKKKR
ncbi:hypothetical protein SAMD00019534_082050 [Acytostelium subglobosum LB1]|uniref:hypothetical protein n=1 Tax=Acytostelium subglobosum LB1 TaxID=1410327 RepID=UPI000644BBA7|nr:hypothetical protein SAMD00019534_082050 [Acytostelium subglobosum LB1]GAM25030.1 hypothetical protein SAMD00019534_082050 [Acytostelium subglobosum LB1]|eukprot:XP_012752119.1 hypothetical protein SAMD00019534_082050 [Acytostelium subglobosum LB1]